jgi:8-oxo-dGTP diphosphatase
MVHILPVFIGDVVCAIIERDGRFLIARRAEGKHLAHKWEFPGGKVEAGESEQDALRRELREELQIEVEIIERMTPVMYCYADRALRLIAWRCRLIGDEPGSCEHEELRWIRIEDTDEFDFPEADLPVIVEYRQKTCHQRS